MKALIILLFATLLLSAIAVQKRSTGLNSAMTGQEAPEYVFRNLQSGHLQFYSRISLNTENGDGMQVCPQELEQKAFASQELLFAKQLDRALNYYHSKLR